MSQSLRARTAVTPAPTPARFAPRRALVWDVGNSSALLVARSFVRQGWAVDWMGAPESPFRASPLWSSRTDLASFEDVKLAHVLQSHPLDALLLHGDEQVRWVLRHWPSLPAAVLRHLPAPQSLDTAMSKQKSMELARSLGLPVLETVVCSSRAEVGAAAAALGAQDEVVLKGEGGAAGAAVRAAPAGSLPLESQWQAVTRHAPTVLVQRRIHGPRCLVTVSYARGVERAACVHEKVVAAPYAFGPAAFGVTRRSDVLHQYAARRDRRVADHLWTADGRRVSGIAITEHFAELFPDVQQVQVVQNRAGHVHVRLVPGAAPADRIAARVAQVVAAAFGAGTSHDLEPVREILPEPSGKFRFSVCTVATAGSADVPTLLAGAR